MVASFYTKKQIDEILMKDFHISHIRFRLR